MDEKENATLAPEGTGTAAEGPGTAADSPCTAADGPGAADLTATVKVSDMPEEMQAKTIEICLDAFRTREKPSSKLATKIKSKMDEAYPTIRWHCIVGHQFASFITHDPGSFMNLTIGKSMVIVFRAT